MIVVDSNVIAYYWIKSKDSELAEKSFKKDSDWVAPYLWRSEFRNILTFYFRKKYISYDDAYQTMIKAQMFMKDNEYSISSEKVFQIIKESNLSAYDSEFVALAKELKIRLITFDKKIISSFPDIALSLKDFVS